MRGGSVVRASAFAVWPVKLKKAGPRQRISGGELADKLFSRERSFKATSDDQDGL
jgi:hypothetical protein